MDSPGILFLFLTVISVTAGNGFVNVQCTPRNPGQHGQQSMLECVVKTAKEAAGAKILVVTWKKVGIQEPLFVYNKGTVSQKSGYKLAEASWDSRNMNVSLLIARTTPQDVGDYECTVITDRGYSSTPVHLSVTAKYNTPTVHSKPEKKIPPNTNVTLFCDSVGGYPEGQIRWYDEHNFDWTSSSKLKVKPNDDGLFSLSSELPLLPGSVFSRYTCSVLNANGVKEGETTFEVPLSSESSELGSGSSSSATSRIVAPVVVIGSLIVGLLMALLFFKRRRDNQACNRYEPSPVEDGLMLPSLTEKQSPVT